LQYPCADLQRVLVATMREFVLSPEGTGRIALASSSTRAVERNYPR